MTPGLMRADLELCPDGDSHAVAHFGIGALLRGRGRARALQARDQAES